MGQQIVPDDFSGLFFIRRCIGNRRKDDGARVATKTSVASKIF